MGILEEIAVAVGRRFGWDTFTLSDPEFSVKLMLRHIQNDSVAEAVNEEAKKVCRDRMCG